MITFTTEELTAIAHSVDPGSPEVIERDGLRFTFGQEYDDTSVMEHIADCESYGKLAWPEPVSSWDPHGQQRRPDGFTGAARKFASTPMHDTIWWEPYRDEHKVYDGPDEVRFMSELLNWGFICLTLTVERRESCGKFHEAAFNILCGIESPLCHPANEGYDYLASVYADLLVDALHEIKETA
jgi:hypothetical protein